MGSVGIDEKLRGEHDAIVLPCACHANIVARDVVANPFRIAAQGISPATATGELNTEQVAPFEAEASDLGCEGTLSRGSGVEHGARGTRRLGAENARGGEFEAVHAQIDDG